MRLKELNLFYNMTHRFWTRFKELNWIEPIFSECDSNFFCKNIQEIEFFLKNSKLIFFFHMTRKLNLLFNMTQRSEPWRKKAERIEPFSLIQRIELFFWKNWSKELDLFKWLKDLNFFSLTQRIEFFFWKGLTELNSFFFESDAKHWTFFPEYDWLKNWPIFLNMTQRLEPIFLEFLHVSKSWTFFKYDAKNWTVFLLNGPQRIEPLSKFGSKNWTFFF